MAEQWAQPELAGKSKTPKGKANVPDRLKPPSPDDIREYLEAFYHELPVKTFTQTLEFTAWESGQKLRTKKDATSSFIGLRCGSSCTRIRTRPCPDGTFAQQLNLDDILDAAIAALPDDAYALLFLVSHDLYEDDDDDFCCGRAYGGSRVAVVSSARYNPALLLSSEHDSIDLDHTWPASHCKSYVARLCGSAPGATAPRGKKRRLDEHEDKSAPSPLQDAVHAIKGSRSVAAAHDLDTSASLSGLWLCLLARTASHELGHCLGIGHCAYYACVMQGTAGMAEDCRQPPYLCLVCLKKLTHAAREATASSAGFDETGYVVGNYQALAAFCDKWKQVDMFASYKAWLDNMTSRLQDASFKL
jgi:archaemetzincin